MSEWEAGDHGEASPDRGWPRNDYRTCYSRGLREWEVYQTNEIMSAAIQELAVEAASNPRHPISGRPRPLLLRPAPRVKGSTTQTGRGPAGCGTNLTR
jgi:hypothetical protein